MEAGAVPVLVVLLLDCKDRKLCEDSPTPAFPLHFRGCSWVVLVQKFHGLLLMIFHRRERGEKILIMDTNEEGRAKSVCVGACVCV